MCPTFLAGTMANREDSEAFDCEIFPFSILFESKNLLHILNKISWQLTFVVFFSLHLCVAYVSKPAPEWPMLQNKLCLKHHAAGSVKQSHFSGLAQWQKSISHLPWTKSFSFNHSTECKGLIWCIPRKGAHTYTLLDFYFLDAFIKVSQASYNRRSFIWHSSFTFICH